MKPNFSGYVTKANLECADGRKIMPGAFAHQDGVTVPLVYMHKHDDINQVLGKVKLTKKEDGVWGDAYLNDTAAGKNADIMVQHGDIDKFSVWAKNLEEQGHLVHDGVIQEVSLVLAGKNPGAFVQNVLMHGDLGDDDLLFVGFELKHDDVAVEEKPAETVDSTEEPAANDKTQQEVLDTLTDEQRDAVNAAINDIVTEAVLEAETNQALEEEPNLQHDNIDSSKKGNDMARSLFDRTKQGDTTDNKPAGELKHDDVVKILTHAKGNPKEGLSGWDKERSVSSLRDLIHSDTGKEMLHSEMLHADYGIENIDILFPDAQKVMARPTFVDRRQEWVREFMAGTSHTPFSRVKTVYADITADEARAKGYIKAHMKTEEVFPIFKRETGPAWIIKKQKLDRQDIIDIVDFDVVAWMKAEMRGKLDEEIARAGLFGDGRPEMVNGDINPDKIPDPGKNNKTGNGIRAVLNDHELYAVTYDVPLAADATGDAWNVLLDKAVEADEFYMGSGNKTAFMSFRTATKLLTIRDDFGHRIYRNLGEVAGDMGMAKIVRVPTELFPTDILCIALDLSDYNFGTNRGGEITLFDDFDIDFNQYKYLIETYLSGALTLPYSAQIFKRVDPTATLVVPTAPVVAANVVTIPTKTGVVYKRQDTGDVVAGGSTITLDEDTLPMVEIEASPASAAYYFGTNDDRVDTWVFEYKA